MISYLHVYVYVFLECPSGSIGSTPCDKPSSAWTSHMDSSSKDMSLMNKTSNGYPHKFWPQFPMVKAIDLLFRVSNFLDWDILCFMEKCNPIMLWRNEVDGKKSSLRFTSLHINSIQFNSIQFHIILLHSIFSFCVALYTCMHVYIYIYIYIFDKNRRSRHVGK